MRIIIRITFSKIKFGIILLLKIKIIIFFGGFMQSTFYITTFNA